MFGFPQVLNDMGIFNIGASLHEDNSIMFPLSTGRRTFYTIRDGNWSDTTIWSTLDGAASGLPTANDDVYIKNNILVDTTGYSCNNIYISQNAVFRSTGTISFTANGNFKSYGTMNLTTGSTVVFRGFDNYIDKSKQSANIFTYSGNGNQAIIDANYSTLRWGLCTPSEKYLTCDLTVGAIDCTNLGVLGASWLNLKSYNFTVNGNLSGAGTHTLIMVSEGNQSIVFKGSADFTGGFYCAGSPTIEFQNGTSFGGNSSQYNVYFHSPYSALHTYFGNGTVRFTTNNQTMTATFANLFLDNNIEIADNITVTLNCISATLNLTKPINGLGSNSILRMGTNGSLNFANQNAAENSMTTGVFDTTTNVNTVSYNGNYSATIPSRFPNFHNLTIGGTGTKTLGVNTTLNGIFTFNGTNNTSIFEMNSYNFVQNQLNSTNNINGIFSKNGSGSVIFSSYVQIGRYQPGGFDFSGNPDVEFKNGLINVSAPGENGWINPFNTGNGQWKFSTNNQILSMFLVTRNINCSILIDNINLTVSNVRIYNSVNGSNLISKLISNGFIYNHTSNQLMITGSLDLTTNSNTYVYAWDGDEDIIYSSFNNLQISGSGTKTLTSNTILSGNIEINGPFNIISSTYQSLTTLETLNYDLIVNGTSSQNRIRNTLSKSGNGLIKFNALVDLTRYAAGRLFFSGLCDIEFMNGLSISNLDSFSNHVVENARLIFSSNNQSLLFLSNNISFNNSNLEIKGVVLSISSVSNANYLSISGTDVNSILRLSTNSLLNYRGTATPMSTGILDTSTNLNTFIYGNGNQNIKGGTYRNLTLNGGGTKTLQGNVSVQNTYTLTSPATLNNNGFTLTNP